MELVVFGASGPTGLLVVRQALAAGHRVVAATRHPETYPLADPGLRAVAADVLDAEQVASAIGGRRAVISTFGVPYSRRPISVYSTGMAHIVAGMAASGATRLVCVSSTSIAPGDTPGESILWRRTLIPLLRNVVGRTLYDDMVRMEEIVERSDLDWTIVRPGGLFDTAEPTSDFVVSPQRIPGRLTSRADLARTLLVEATEGRHPRATIEVLSRSELPGFRAFLRSAFNMGS